MAGHDLGGYGEHDEIVEPGAFERTVREQGDGVRLLGGQLRRICEDDHGLFIAAALHDASVAGVIRSDLMRGVGVRDGRS